uniref:Uncharacterized protein n=1 Tax=Cacopsylla melanoneura TaxID=428564 RepID=A0A8D8T561_9HEMI
MHSCQIFPRQIQNETQVPSSTLPTSRTGAQAHVLTSRGLQHRRRTAVYQEADRHADVDHDQGDRPLRPGPRERNPVPRQARGLQQRCVRTRVRSDHLEQHDGSARASPAAAQATVRGSHELDHGPSEFHVLAGLIRQQTASPAQRWSVGYARQTVLHRG